MSLWFGDPWPRADYRAPICEDDAEHAITPVGEKCVWCDEAIVVGDRGSSMTVVRMDPDNPLRAIPSLGWTHIECSMRATMGNTTHMSGHCRHIGDCNDQEADKSYRQQALDAWDYLNGMGRMG